MDDPRRAEARRLRVEPGLSLGELMKHFGVGSATLTDWLRGISPPEWTRRPNAKDELRQQALELRGDGWFVNDLAVKLDLTDRDVLLVGAAIYWCEGAKSKPWRRLDRLEFINSDPGLLRLFLRVLEVSGRARETLNYRVHTHETADADAAGDWWADQLDLPREQFQRPTIKNTSRTPSGSTAEPITTVAW